VQVRALKGRSGAVPGRLRKGLPVSRVPGRGLGRRRTAGVADFPAEALVDVLEMNGVVEVRKTAFVELVY